MSQCRVLTAIRHLDKMDELTLPYFNYGLFRVTVGQTEVGSASHNSCAVSARATTLKFLQRKRFRNPKKIIAPQAQAKV